MPDEDLPHVRCVLGKVMRGPGNRDAMYKRVGWVPTHLAEVGYVITLRCPPELFPNGWEVMELLDKVAPAAVSPPEPCPRREAG